jgi:hypothetical protein
MKRWFVFLSIATLLVGIADGVLQAERYSLQNALYTSRQQAYQKALLPEASLPQKPTPTPHRPDLVTGITFPQWGSAAYGNRDANWEKGLQEIKQLHARWIAMTLPLHMTGSQATHVQTRTDTPTVQAFREGIEKAHRLGFRVFVTPQITLDGAQGWEGAISFSSQWRAQIWFTGYWQVLQPYIHVLQGERVEMLSIGNEYHLLEDESPEQWQRLIRNIRAIFTGKLIYSLNWASFTKPLPSWIGELDTIGCSTYFSVTSTPQRLTAQQAVQLWKSNVQLPLDQIARRVGKPIVITEIGYRSGPTAGYLPYIGGRQEPGDDQEQAILFHAALQNLSADHKVSGIFWWAWSLPPFSPKKAAVQVLARWFLYF